MNTSWQHKAAPYSVAVGSIILTTIILEPFQARLNSTTVALALLLEVLFTATFIGRYPALLASCVAMQCFNLRPTPRRGNGTRQIASQPDCPPLRHSHGGGWTGRA